MSKIHLKVLLRVICIAIAFLFFYWLRGLRTLLARFLGGMINVDRTMCLGHISWFKNMGTTDLVWNSEVNPRISETLKVK